MDRAVLVLNAPDRVLGNGTGIDHLTVIPAVIASFGACGIPVPQDGA